MAVGSGTPAMAKGFCLCSLPAFVTETQFPGALYVDPKRAIYEALDCKRGLKFVLSKQTLAAAKQARGEGFSQGKKAGDSL